MSIQSSTTKEISNSDILDFFRCRIDSLTENSVKDYTRALAFLAGFIPCDATTFVGPSVELVEEWCIYLMNTGMTKKTVSHYIDIISGLYSAAANEGLVEHTDVFRTVKSNIRTAESTKTQQRISEDEYSRLRHLACVRTNQPKEAAIFIDIFFLAILTGCKPIMEIAMMKKDEISYQSPQISAILERYCNSNRKYIFPLSQSEKTPRQLERDLTNGITASLISKGIKIFETLTDTIQSYWAYAAMKCGLPPSAIYSILGSYPKVFPGIGIKNNPIQGIEDKESIIQTIAETFLFNPAKWYAMRLRPRVSINDIEKRLEMVGSEIIQPEFFYPSREIARRIGKKTLLKEVPVISDIIFFKSRITDIYPLFTKIGDLAWCYRSGNGTGAYAAIPKDSMEQFQRAVGSFTDDYEIGPIGSIKPQPGDVIRIIDGAFAGNKGELLKIMDAKETGVIYRLRLIDNQGVEWKIRVDSRLTEPVADRTHEIFR